MAPKLSPWYKGIALSSEDKLKLNGRAPFRSSGKRRIPPVPHRQAVRFSFHKT
jgi:hypothetical protein